MAFSWLFVLILALYLIIGIFSQQQSLTDTQKLKLAFYYLDQEFKDKDNVGILKANYQYNCEETAMRICVELTEQSCFSGESHYIWNNNVTIKTIKSNIKKIINGNDD